MAIMEASTKQPRAQRGRRTPWPTFALCIVAVFLVLLETTILFVAFHGIRASFRAASNAELSWVLNRMLIAGGLATALLSLPIDTRPSRAGVHESLPAAHARLTTTVNARGKSRA